MSKRAYVLVGSDGAVAEVARPLQGSLVVYTKDSMVNPIKEYPFPGPGVWFVKLAFRRLMAFVDGTPKKVDVRKKITQVEKSLGMWAGGAQTASPGISGYQHRADAASSAMHNRRRENEGLLKWLKNLHESRKNMGKRNIIPVGSLKVGSLKEAQIYGEPTELPPLLDKQMRFLLKELEKCRSHIIDKRAKARSAGAGFAEKNLKWAEEQMDRVIDNVSIAIPSGEPVDQMAALYQRQR